MTNLDIAAQAMIFFTAGFESVTTSMGFMAYELALHPDVQGKLRAEIEETFKACDGNVTYEALMRMKYLDMVISGTIIIQLRGGRIFISDFIHILTRIVENIVNLNIYLKI